MNKRIPSISSLLAFEAAARYLSFTRAAIELNLTQAAISHQIKNLEELLGTTLFTRNASPITVNLDPLIFIDFVNDEESFEFKFLISHFK